MILQAEPDYRTKPEDLQNMFVRNTTGDMVPLKAVATTRYVSGADIVTRFNNFTAAKISGGAAPGYSSGQALDAMEEIAKEVLPQGFSTRGPGRRTKRRRRARTAGLVFAFALVMVFLILAAQYEKWPLPIGVLLAVPFALFGAHRSRSGCAASRTTCISRSGSR